MIYRFRTSCGRRTRAFPITSKLVCPAFLLISLAAGGQTPPAVGSVPGNMQIPTPGLGHDYIHLLSETVDPTSGNLTLRIQLPVPQGRGITPPTVVAYNSGELDSLLEPNGQLIWATSSLNQTPSNGWGTASSSELGGSATEWNQSQPPPPNGSGFDCNYVGGFSLTDLHGTPHTLGIGAFAQAQGGQGGANCGSGVVNTGQWDQQMQAVIPSSATQQLAGGSQITVNAEDIYGNTYTFLTAGTGTGGGVTGMEDRNGNTISATTDTAGRALVFQIGTGTNSPTTYTVDGLKYTVTTTTTTVAYTPEEYSEIWEEGATNCNVTGVFGENKATITVISSIELPNNQLYQFQYDPVYGTINRIIYPDGGWVEYTWGLSSGAQAASSFPAQQADGGDPMPNACTFEYQTPVVQTRTVSFDGQTTAQTQSFTYSTSWNSNDGWTSKETKVWTTDNLRGGQQYFTDYKYTPVGTGVPSPLSTASFDAVVPVEQTVSHYDWGNPAPSKALDTVTKNWYNQFQEACEIHTLNSGRSYGHFYQWNYGFISDDKEYDFQSGSALASDCSSNTPPSNPTKETKTYFYQFTSPVPPSLSFAKPCAVITALGNGTEIAETDYGYDENGVGPVSSLTSHDESNFSATFQGTAQPYSSSNCTANGSTPEPGRGNVTTVKRKCFQTSCEGDSTTTYKYDETGQVVSATDPCGNGSCADMPTGSHTTTYSWLDSYSSGTPPGQTDTYLTQITDPTGYGESAEYRWSDGKISQKTDKSGVVTEYVYGGTPSQCSAKDSLDRLTIVTIPSYGNSTQYCYNDGAYNGTLPNLSTYTWLFGSTWKQTIDRFDGLGHTWQTVLVEPSSVGSNDTVETSYDGEGQVYTKTNPHRSSALSTDGTTTSYYNASGQPVAQQNPDSSWLNWCYNGIQSIQPSGSTNVCLSQGGDSNNLGMWVDSTDETGRHWQRISDSFGRLTEVLEPDTNNSPTIETAYTYDDLDDLTQVDQWGGPKGSTGDRQRVFSYDSLSRLLSANNPETGTNTYSFDLSGNTSSKTDARSQAVWYCYDLINRITGDAYSQQSCPMNSPVDSFAYDTPVSSWNDGSSQKNVAGRLSGEFTGSTGTVLGYNQIGEVNFQSSCTPSTCGTTQLKFVATYDQAGDLSTLKYPDSRLVTWTVDQAQHLSSVVFTSWGTTSVNYNYLATTTPPTYWPDGSPWTMTYGNGLTTTWNRNDRLQPLETKVQNSVPTTLLDRQYCYGTASVSGSSCSTPSQADNGNILQIVDGVNSSNTQTMTYDNLNRIASFTNTPATMYQTYAIDAWGNTVMNGTQVNGLSFSGSPYNNRDKSGTIGYDAAGNSTSVYVGGGITNTFAFDPMERISSINSGATAYTYGADSQRMAKTTGSNWTEYLYFNGDPVAENNSNTANHGEWTDYIFADGLRIAEAYTNSPTSPSTTTNYYSSDQVHSTSMLTNGSGGVVESYEYYPFGVGASADSNNHYLFTGKERDTESGNDYFGARYYASTMGRFLSPDPIWINTARLVDPQRLNLYAYVRNSPLSLVDADGMDVSLGSCGENSTISMCEAAVKNGVPEADRDHIHFIQGNGKNGFDKGQWGVQVDKDYKSTSNNFTTLQALANDHSGLAKIDVLDPTQGYSIKVSTAWSASKGDTISTERTTMGYPKLDKGIGGYTLFPYGSNSPGPWSIGSYTNVIANTSLDLPQTIYHELQHVFIGDFGKTGFNAQHGQPGVDQKTKQAEEEAAQNETQQ